MRAGAWFPTATTMAGLSGASLDRPALQNLLADVRAGKITIVVVYKVDRLTRSLADFAKLVELFDQYGVSFVSITQSFNTTRFGVGSLAHLLKNRFYIGEVVYRGEMHRGEHEPCRRVDSAPASRPIPEGHSANQYCQQSNRSPPRRNGN
jgi:hypothetical protein